MLWVGEQLCVQLAGAAGLCGKREEVQEGSRRPGQREAGAASAAPHSGSERLVLVLKVERKGLQMIGS